MSTAGQGLGRVLNYTTQIILARMYGPAQLGFYALGIIMIGIAKLAAEFGLSGAVIRFVAQYQAEGDTSRVRGTIMLSLGASFALSLAISVSIFLGAGLLAEGVFSEPALTAVFRAFSVSIPFFTVMSVALAATEGFQTVKYSTLVREIIQPAAHLILIVAFYLLGAQILGPVVSYAISMAGSAILALFYLWRIFPALLDRSVPAKSETGEMLNVSAPMFAAVSLEYINNWTPVTLLGVLATSEAVGVYSAAIRTALLSSVVYVAFTSIFAAMISSLYRRGMLGELSALYQEVSRWIFTCGIAVFLLTALLSKDIMATFGGEFVIGWTAIVIIACAQLFNSSIGATEHTLLMTGHQKIYMMAFLMSAVVNFALCFVLIPAYGVNGAALSAAASICVASVATLAALRKLLGFWPYHTGYAKPAAAGIATAAVYFLVSWLLPVPQGVLSILILAPLIGAVFVGALLLLGLPPGEKKLVGAVLTAMRQAVRRKARATQRGPRP